MKLKIFRENGYVGILTIKDKDITELNVHESNDSLLGYSRPPRSTDRYISNDEAFADIGKLLLSLKGVELD